MRPVSIHEVFGDGKTLEVVSHSFVIASRVYLVAIPTLLVNAKTVLSPKDYFQVILPLKTIVAR